MATELTEQLFDFAAGVNSDPSPLLLPPNQLADALNVTVRGTFATHRPYIRQIALDYGGSLALQAAVEEAVFQGGGYFRPDVGAEGLMASIAGRLFQFTPGGGASAVVQERLIPGGPNSPTQSQVWMWQAESWMIVNDGVALPLFVDSGSVRRSSGPGSVVAITSANFNAPAVGAIVNISLTANYTGPIGVIVDINGAKYLVISTGAASTGFTYTIRNNNAPPGNPVASGAASTINTGFLGYTTQAFTLVGYGAGGTPPGGGISPTFPNGTGTGQIIYLPLDRDVTNSILHQYLTFAGTPNVAFIYQVASNSIHIVPVVQSTHQNDKNIPINTAVILNGGTVVSLGTVATTFNNPAIGGTTTVELTQNYTGPFPQDIFIGGFSYTIISNDSGTAANTLNIQNINDIPGALQSSPANLITISEMLAGRMGTYGLGRNWYSKVDGLSFRATDIVGGSSGTVSFNFRDAVLKEEDNTTLLTGDFRLPGANGVIRAMRFISILDRSLGQGPLEVLTPNIVFSCDAPVDITNWQSLTNPILTETLKPKGGLGQNSTINANSDLFFRSSDGIRSLILGQRQFATWGNVAQSAEVSPTVDSDNQTLLPYSSAINFDNRLLMTANPVQGPNGVYHDKLVVINFDPISSLQGKAQSVWDGVWQGLNVLQLVVGEFNSLERAFAFCFNPTTAKNELWEILRSADTSIADSNGPVTWEIQSGSLFKQTGQKNRDYKQLEDGEIYVDQLVGSVTFEAFYKPDQWPNWVPWWSWTETHTGGTLGFRPRMGLGQPKATDVDSENDRPLRNFYTMQFKLVITGHCRFLGARFKAFVAPEPKFATPR